MANLTVRVIAKDTTKKQFRTVNITTTKAAHVKTHAQAPTDNRTFETVMDSAGMVAGLKTLHIAGYTGPL